MPKSRATKGKAPVEAEAYTHDEATRLNIPESGALPQGLAERVATIEPVHKFTELRAVNVSNTATSELCSDAGETVHAVFIAQERDRKPPSTCQELLPKKKDSWTKIAKNLRGTIDEDAFSGFRTLVFLPFKPGTAYGPEEGEGRVQVKLIDQRGNAVVKTVRV